MSSRQLSTPLVTPTRENIGSRLELGSLKNQTSGNYTVYLQCYFVTIATVLGTGILGLPVTLANAGLYPFLVTFIGGYVVQALLIYFFTDLLQKAYAIQAQNSRNHAALLSESLPLNEFVGDEDFSSEINEGVEEYLDSDEPPKQKRLLEDHVYAVQELDIQPPTLHLLGELFLVCGVRQLFSFIILLHFIAFLISYALAGSQAYAQLLGIDAAYIIPGFIWVLGFAVVFALQIIQPIVSLLTFIKGSLLLATVVVTFVVGANIHRHITSDFTFVGEPFLMGTVALGGVINVMPFLYGRVKPVRNQVLGFRNAVVLGITTCMVINILWCWAVLDIVPQHADCTITPANTSLWTGPIVLSEKECAQKVSLANAANAGEISTIPLSKIINSVYPKFSWVAKLIEMFIIISITVSFLTFGAALHHTLSGLTESFFNEETLTSYSEAKTSAAPRRCPAFCHVVCFTKIFISLMVFGIVFCVAMMNPKGFVPILEQLGSLVANLEAGIFVFLMIRGSFKKDYSGLVTPLPLSEWVYHLQYLILLYFSFAVGYDIFTTSYKWFHKSLPSFSNDTVTIINNQTIVMGASSNITIT